jgi:hypothetical protein
MPLVRRRHLALVSLITVVTASALTLAAPP